MSQSEFKPRWYGKPTFESCPVQVDGHFKWYDPDDTPTVPQHIADMAIAEYKAQGHHQSLEKINRRGGFYLSEVIQLLADRLDRIEHNAS